MIYYCSQSLVLALQIAIADKLVKKAKIKQQSIVILSPYNAQVSEIREELKRKKMDQITVTTITKSQGESAPRHHNGKIFQSKTTHCEELLKVYMY